MQEASQDLRPVISQFIRHLHETGGSSISHVTVTVHGKLKHFVAEQRISHFPVNKMAGITELSYQDMEVEAPIENKITIIATRGKP